ncbi:MAG: DNA recombination protein RmuC [bacterium]
MGLSIWAILGAVGVLVILILWMAMNTRRRIRDLEERRGSEQALLVMEQRIANLTTQLTNQLNAVTSQVSERLVNTTEVVTSVKESLGRMEEANRRIYEVGKDISSLQELLRAPTFRGEVGEFLLANLLGQILPQEHFSLKHKFKNGEIVDAVIRLGNRLVPIDSKFPLENFKKMLESSGEEERQRSRKEFVRDVKKHIDDVSDKYILPDEDTFDFALLYIPAENVYYETIIKDEPLCEGKGICSYALSKKVIPVSPNSFYAYLQALVLGLKGLRIEKAAEEILGNLTRLHGDLVKFREDFEVLGKHLSSSRAKYEEAEKKLDRLGEKLLSVGEEKPPEIPEESQ